MFRKQPLHFLRFLRFIPWYVRTTQDLRRKSDHRERTINQRKHRLKKKQYQGATCSACLPRVFVNGAPHRDLSGSNPSPRPGLHLCRRSPTHKRSTRYIVTIDDLRCMHSLRGRRVQKLSDLVPLIEGHMKEACTCRNDARQCFRGVHDIIRGRCVQELSARTVLECYQHVSGRQHLSYRGYAILPAVSMRGTTPSSQIQTFDYVVRNAYHR